MGAVERLEEHGRARSANISFFGRVPGQALRGIVLFAEIPSWQQLVVSRGWTLCVTLSSAEEAAMCVTLTQPLSPEWGLTGREGGREGSDVQPVVPCFLTAIA